MVDARLSSRLILRVCRSRRVRFNTAARGTALLSLLTAAVFAYGFQSGGSSAPKIPANPLTALLQQKPKVPIETPQLPAAIPEQPTAIPLPDVAARSLLLSQQLRDAEAKLPTRDQIDALQSAVADLEPGLATKVEQVDALLSGSPNSLEVREEESFWHDVKQSAVDWETQLLGWANGSQRTLNELAAEEPEWQLTFDENKDNKEIGPVLTVIENNLKEIRRLRKRSQDSLQSAVNLQIRVGNIDSSASGVLAKLETARTQLKGHLLDRDSLPLWKINMRRDFGENPTSVRSVTGRWISISAYLRNSKGWVLFLFVLLGVSLMAARRLYDATRNKQPSDELEAATYRFLRRWVAVGLLPPMILGYLLAPSAPVSLIGLLILISFYPIISILPPLLDHHYRRIFYTFSLLYCLMWVISWSGLSSALRRDLEFACSLAMFAILAYLVRPTRERPESSKPLLLLAVRICVIAWAGSLAANLFGYLKLAHYLAFSCLYSSFVAISIYTIWRVVNMLLVVGLRSPKADNFAVVRLHKDGIVRWVPRILKILAILVWLKGTIDLQGFSDGVNSAVVGFLNIHPAGSASGATLGGVLGFFVILALGYAVASSARFVFREEILRRFHMSRGLPELLATIVYYLLMVFVVLMAVNAGGIELNKFTVLTGAFGVGIGFGLQNIINNFVSGLILQFERPIHIDDILEVDNNTGTVSRIGIRSSTIRTFQGAEVIIPNATLISSKVINWTLSESQRRRELPVGVAYGTNPSEVLKILLDAAARHELVLTKPEPMAYFKGFGDSSLDFELHFWVMQEHNGLKITSEVAIAVMDSLNRAGIEIPFPQRDLHLRSVDPGVGEALQSGQAAPLKEPSEV